MGLGGLGPEEKEIVQILADRIGVGVIIRILILARFHLYYRLYYVDEIMTTAPK